MAHRKAEQVLPVMKLAVAIGGLLAAAAAAGQSESYKFDISTKSMSAALREYARISGQQIIFTEEVVAGVQAAPVSGELTAAAALDRLLAGTHLVTERSPSGALMVRTSNRYDTEPAIRLAQAEPAAAAQAAVAAPAAEASTASSLLETVNVSASRIRVEGYEAPTPVTVIGADAIQREAKVDVGDLIRDLPSFGASSSPNNTANQGFVTNGVTGLNLVSLRNLGFNRNLVLFDGQRVVASSIQGGVDLNTLPASLVERIEVVTGGASASWGSDAVAGVVNVILNKKFTGFESHVEMSDNLSNKHAQRKYEASFGTPFAGQRGHLILSASRMEVPDEYFSYDIPGHRYQALVNNPAYAPGNGQPRLIHAENVGLARATPGGLITSGPLAGTHFVGPEATPMPFDAGNVSAGYYSNGGTLNTAESDIGIVSLPSKSETYFGYTSFEITEGLKASLQLNRGRYRSSNNSWSYIRYGNLNISADNPYIPASVRQQMSELGLSSFMLGTMNQVPGHRSLGEQARSLGTPVINTERELSRGVLSFDGTINADWTWNAYVQYGEADLHIRGLNNIQPALYNLAVDAVRVTPENVGSSGLAIGSIACRSTLTNPGNGCAPLNVFGVGNASPEAIQYVNSVARTGGHWLAGTQKQTVGSISLSGKLPFGLDAGPISTAFGVEYRKEEGMQDASPAAQASTFQLGNFKDFYGKYDTHEAFVEFNVPLLKDQGVQSLTADAAGRLTDYSTSGKVETYKFGLVSQFVDSFRVRASYSFDIRAPQLFDLFNRGLPVTGNAIDPRTNLPVAIFSTTRGNRGLQPEESKTMAIGFVLTPTWLSGFNLSLDYYNIDIDGAFALYNTATIVAQCASGSQLFCDSLLFNGPAGALSEVIAQPLNADTLTTSGLDLAVDYRLPVGPGTLGFNAVANYMFEQEITQLGRPFDYAGSINRDSPYDGVPQLNGMLGFTYLVGGWSATVQSRFMGKAKLNNAWGPMDVDDNDIPAVAYLDLRASYKWSNGINVYAAVDNVLDKDPPPAPFTVTGSSVAETPYVDALYDAFGPVWRAGVRVKF